MPRLTLARATATGLTLMTVALYWAGFNHLRAAPSDTFATKLLTPPIPTQDPTTTVHIPVSDTAVIPKLLSSLCHGNVSLNPVRVHLYSDEFQELSALVTVAGDCNGIPLSVFKSTALRLTKDNRDGNIHWLFLLYSPMEFCADLGTRLHQAVNNFNIRSESMLREVVGLSIGPLNYDWVRPGYQPRGLPGPVRDYHWLQQPQINGGLYPWQTWDRLNEWQQSKLQAGVAGRLFDMTDDSATGTFYSLWKSTFLRYLLESGSGVVYLPPTALLAMPLFSAPGLALVSSDATIFPISSPLLSPHDPFFNDALTAGANIGTLDTSEYGTCTMILTVYNRYTTFIDRIRFFETLLVLHSIVVIWNAVEHEIPDLSGQIFRIPVIILPQASNSLNNRFFPHQQIETDCIINMDDDWNMPHSLLYHAVRLWRSTFQDNLVGMKKLGRLHAVDADAELKYCTNSSMPHSIVLPSGMVYHRKYLSWYSFKLPPAARKLVDSLTNCDDLLFNMMVTNATGEPPVFVSSKGIHKVHVLKSLEKKAKGQALWKRRKHYTDRHLCLKEMQKFFRGHLPLLHTSAEFTVDNTVDAELPKQHAHANGQWTCTLCQGPAKDDCISCHQNL